MKILVIGEKNWHGRWVEGTYEAFQKVADADIFFYKEESRNVFFRGCNFLRRKIRVFDALYSRIFNIRRKIIQLVKRNNYDMVFILKGGDIQEEILADIKKHVPLLANWWVDDPFNKDANQNLYKYYDFFFIFDSYYIPKIQKLGVKNVHWLPCAFNPASYFPGEVNPKYVTDLTFVASYFPPREELFIYLKNEKLDISIWGPGWEKAPLEKFFQMYPNSLKGVYLPNSEAASLYRSAKICINLNHNQSKIDGINQRMLEIIACGGFQICDFRQGFSSIFEDKKEIVYFKKPEEIPGLIDFYLKNEDLRKSIVQKGLKKVNEEHSFDARVKEVLRIVSG
ncbi:MAG: glycosyltransferase [Leptospiraceae bacterium]|nr:glycosyltransferase [Leptospiraceae bacterium]